MNVACTTRALTALALLAPLWLGGCGTGEDLVAPRPDGLVLSAEQSGPGDDPDGIVVVVDSAARHSLLPDSTLELSDLAPGRHTLAVEGLGPGCTLGGPNPRDVTVIPDSLVPVVLEIACVVTGPGGTLVVAVQTQGVDPDADGYAVLVDTRRSEPLGATDTIAFTGLSADSHVVRLTGVPDRCTIAGENPRTFRVEEPDTTMIAWEVTCWPPVSGRIAFARSPVSASGRNVYTMNADGTDVVQLTGPEGNRDDEPEWSPDGTRVAYVNDTSSFSRGSQLRVLDVASRRVLVVHTASLILFAPHWSPDGTQLSFEDSDDEPGSVLHVYLVPADGRGPPRRLAHVGQELDAVWSRDGARLAFRGTPASGSERVYVTDLEGTSSTPVSPTGLSLALRDDGIDWSPDGSRIVFAAAHPLGADFGSDLYVVDADGTSEPVNITASARFSSNVQPRWSPDGRLIAYACSDVDRDGLINDICTIPPEGGTRTNLTKRLDSYHALRWSPDGSRVVFTRPAERGGGSRDDLFVVNADGSGLVRLTDSDAGESSPSWGR
jgi:TolB protein